MQVRFLSPALIPGRKTVDSPLRPDFGMSQAPENPIPDDWTPEVWRDLPTAQQPEYPDADRLRETVASLGSLPPLTTSWEIEKLKSQLAEAARGDRFLLQGGDCAERFDECASESIAARLKILLQMSLVLAHGGRRRVIRVGRFAGQYAKPRSTSTERRGDVELPSYRGDIVNGPRFDPASRIPDPARLLQAHGRSAMTLNFIRSLVDGGFADLHHPEYWDLDFVHHSPLAADYQRMVESIGEGLRFMESLAGVRVQDLSRVDFFTSHEALLLEYEAALTRRVPHRDGWWNLSTHLPWIGLRTADPTGGHVAYMAGIRNPVAVKIGPGIEPSKVVELAEILDPEQEPGRLTLIHRFGRDGVDEGLPAVIEAVRDAGREPLWVCDPMHGNTRTVTPTSGSIAGTAVKTRSFDDILHELERSFEIHEACGTRLGGVHFELTGENVTECVGGARGLADADLGHAYRSQVDPRLNYEQALEMAMLIARRMRDDTA
ncbi:MAG: 3-deoxy-7-phosphoheptulonate synthase class II [Phycisphaerae bacterium]|nr:3-deoxy-7-phosphoheptulonate synthase class II [Phycisphaerae bacterium]